MKVRLNNLRTLALIEVSWRPMKEQGRLVAIDAWYYVEGKGDVFTFDRPNFISKGWIVVKVHLPGFFDFEYKYKEHEKLERINVEYERRS